MVRHAATGHVLEAGVGIELRIEMPLLFTGSGIKREQTLVCGTKIQRIADFNWRHFIGDLTRIVRLLQITGAKHPRFFQVMDVVGVDLFERREALAFLITAIRRPVVVGDRGDGFSRRRIGAQRAIDFLWVIEARPGQDPTANQQGHHQSGDGTPGRDNQTMPDKR